MRRLRECLEGIRACPALLVNEAPMLLTYQMGALLYARKEEDILKHASLAMEAIAIIAPGAWPTKRSHSYFDLLLVGEKNLLDLCCTALQEINKKLIPIQWDVEKLANMLCDIKRGRS